MMKKISKIIFILFIIINVLFLGCLKKRNEANPVTPDNPDDTGNGNDNNNTIIVLFEDDFNRPDSDIVGNGWVEIEDVNQKISITNNQLKMYDNNSGSSLACKQTNFNITNSIVYYELDISVNDSTQQMFFVPTVTGSIYDTTYHIKVKVDCINETFNYYVNGNLVMRNCDWYGSGFTRFQEFQFYSFPANSGFIAYIDNVKIYIKK